jgi:hypothetical protein
VFAFLSTSVALAIFLSLGIAEVSIVVFDGDEEEKKMKRWDTP